MLIPVVFALSYSASTVLYKHHLSHNKRCRCHDDLFVSCILSAVHEIQQSDFGYDSLFSCSLATNIYATFIKHLCKHTHTQIQLLSHAVNSNPTYPDTTEQHSRKMTVLYFILHQTLYNKFENPAIKPNIDEC